MIIVIMFYVFDSAVEVISMLNLGHSLLMELTVVIGSSEHQQEKESSLTLAAYHL